MGVQIQTSKPNLDHYRAMSDFNTIPPIESNLPPAQSDDLFVSAMDSPTDSGLDGVGSDLTESDRPKTGSDTMEDLSLQVSTGFWGLRAYSGIFPVGGPQFYYFWKGGGVQHPLGPETPLEIKKITDSWRGSELSRYLFHISPPAMPKVPLSRIEIIDL